jgi:hypothetical protein
VYYTTTVERTCQIFQDGWADWYEEFGMSGVYLATHPLDVNDGLEGDATLCLDVPDALFQQYDVTDELQKASGYRLALVPAAELNRLGKPQVYDHFYAGCSRRELVKEIETWEADGSVSSYQFANEMREAMTFFDRIGWLTPLKLREEAQ